MGKTQPELILGHLLIKWWHTTPREQFTGNIWQTNKASRASMHTVLHLIFVINNHHKPSFAAGLTDNRSMKCWCCFEQSICCTSCICITTCFLMPAWIYCCIISCFHLLTECSEDDAAVQCSAPLISPSTCDVRESLWKGKEMASFLTKENPPYTPVAATSLLHVLHWSQFVFNCSEVKEKVCVCMCVYNIGVGSILLCQWE